MKNKNLYKTKLNVQSQNEKRKYVEKNIYEL